jgi:hypothetical protein
VLVPERVTATERSRLPWRSTWIVASPDAVELVRRTIGPRSLGLASGQ